MKNFFSKVLFVVLIKFALVIAAVITEIFGDPTPSDAV